MIFCFDQNQVFPSLYNNALRIRRWARISSNADDVPVVVVPLICKPDGFVLGSLLSKPNACFILFVSLAWNHSFGISESNTPENEQIIADITSGEYFIANKYWSITKMILKHKNQFFL